LLESPHWIGMLIAFLALFLVMIRVPLANAGKPDDPAAPIRAAADLLLGGEIVALKGLGGFHLACDATDGDVVRRLKERKRRPHKPLAVMFGGLDELRAHCVVSPDEAELLTSPEHPIVLLEWRSIGPAGEAGPELGATTPSTPSGVAPPPVDPEVAIGQRYLGAMLPYSPLHHLLLSDFGAPLVATSGNGPATVYMTRDGGRTWGAVGS